MLERLNKIFFAANLQSLFYYGYYYYYYYFYFYTLTSTSASLVISCSLSPIFLFTVFSIMKVSRSISSSLNVINFTADTNLGINIFSIALDLRFVLSISYRSFLNVVSFSAISNTVL